MVLVEAQAWAAGLAIAIAATATGYAQSKIGEAVAQMIVERPEEKGISLVLLAIPETSVVLTFVICVLILTS